MNLRLRPFFLSLGLALVGTAAACGSCNPTPNGEEDAGGDPGTTGGNDGGTITRHDAGTSGGNTSSSGGESSSSGGTSSGGTSSSGGTTSSGGTSSSGGGTSSSGPTCIDHEICGDGLDNDCANGADDGCNCNPGATQACFDGPPSQAGRGVCNLGTQTCEFSGETVGWGPCVGQGHPQDVVCGQHLDFKCDGQLDEGCPCELNTQRPCYTGPGGTEGRGLCHAGTQTCVGPGTAQEWSECYGQVTPVPDACNGQDSDCDGSPNTNCSCELNATQPCYTGPAGTNGLGLCHGGQQSCESTGAGAAWSECRGQMVPGSELCDGQDHDCDGTPNTGCSCQVGQSRACYTGSAGTENHGVCHGGVQLCESRPNGSGWGGCTGEVVPSLELCNGGDQDCDGTVNTGCQCQINSTRPCYTGPQGTQGVGLCHGGTQTCVQQGASPGWGDCVGQVTPGAENCDGQDHLCNGQIGIGCTCRPGDTQQCYTGNAATRGRGICHDGTQTCAVVSGQLGWGASCPGQVLPAASEQCANNIDDNCSGQVDENCGGTITCPGDTVMDAGDTHTFTVSGVGVSNFTWSITAAPTGGAASAVWNPAPPTGTSVSFLPYIVGVYTIRVAGKDQNNTTQACTFNVTAQSHGLRIELTWDGDGDVDLHLHNPNNTAWYTADDDSYHYKTQYVWVGGWGGPDGASLDTDNTVSNGPENIRINTPSLNADYTVAVHNYARAAGRLATVKIFCGTTEGTDPTRTFVSRALAGTDSGDCTANDFWKVAKVRFTSASSCTITAINGYGPSSSACNSL